MKKSIKIIILILVLISIITSMLIFNNQSNKIEKNFTHRDISKLEFEKYEAKEDYEVDGEFYWGNYEEGFNYALSPREYIGRYYAAKMNFKDKLVVIEENVIGYKHDGSYDGAVVDSILYCEQGLTKDYAIKYIEQAHNEDRCGIEIRKFKLLKRNYYYVQYQIPEEC